MSIFDNVKMALASLVANKLRSLLTMLGIIIGVASVIALQAIGQGTVDTAQKSLEKTGTNLITISPSNQSVGGIAQSTTNNNLTVEDATALEDTSRVGKASGVSPENQSGGQFVAGSKNSFGATIGTTAGYLAVHDATLVAGDWFTDADVTGARSVVVLGATQATSLFDDAQSAVGKTMQIQRNFFTIVGVLAPKGGTGFGSIDSQVFIPITTSQRRVTGFRPGGATTTGKTVSQIVLKASDQNSVDDLITQVTDVLRERHKIQGSNDDFQIVNQQDLLQQAKDQQATFNTFLLIIASISLFVGGLGIMNIMLVTVTERTREIGIRKALGATHWTILSQFMFESVTLCFVGGLIGVVFGVVAAIIMDSYYQHTVVSLPIVGVAVAFAVAVGLFFGIYPARRAALLNPIDALRYE